MEKPKIARKGPYVMDVEPGNFFWCTCGQSANQPFCDGSHKDTGFTPLKVEITESKKVAFCGCKHSGSKPFCDGTHSKL